jgi:hypothetical protein
MVMIPTGLGSENDCAGEDQPEIVNDRPILSSERMLNRIYDRKCSVEKKNTGRESQGDCRQDELICGKPPVIK